MALATIVNTLRSEAPRLGAAELSALAETLAPYAQEVHAAEDAARDILSSR